MKKHILSILVLLFCSLSILAQNQDEVMYSMYRYHPIKIIKELGVDSVYIRTFKEDTSFLSSIITYDTLGRETKFIDVEYGFEYRMDYYPTGLLKTSRIIDYDHGAGPVDSFVYNKKGKMTQSFNGINGEYTFRTYKYKKGKLIEENGDGFKYKYTYKKGRRITNEIHSKKGKALKSYKSYEYNKAGNLYKIFENDNKKWLNFQLFYNPQNLLTQMKVYGKGLKLAQQYTTVYFDNGLINHKVWQTGIKNNDPSNCDYQKNVYTYSYRK